MKTVVLSTGTQPVVSSTTHYLLITRPNTVLRYVVSPMRQTVEVKTTHSSQTTLLLQVQDLHGCHQSVLKSTTTHSLTIPLTEPVRQYISVKTVIAV